jgi:hypothetical protein
MKRFLCTLPTLSLIAVVVACVMGSDLRFSDADPKSHPVLTEAQITARDMRAADAMLTEQVENFERLTGLECYKPNEGPRLDSANYTTMLVRNRARLKDGTRQFDTGIVRAVPFQKGWESVMKHGTSDPVSWCKPKG